MSGSHNKIIADAAKVELGPLGFKRIGRSRLWLADYGTWLNVVEFTPNRWSKGVYLHNAAHWLWAGKGYLTFDYDPDNRRVVSSWANYETDDQFQSAVAPIARLAAEQALEIEERLSTFDKTAEYVVDRTRGDERMEPSWWGYEAGIASGLCNSWKDARYFLSGVTDKRVVGHAAPLLAVIDRPQAFKDLVNRLLAEQRAALKLPALGYDPF